VKVVTKKQWTQEVTCTGRSNQSCGCGSVLEITKADIRFYEGKSGNPATDGTFFYAPKAAVIRCVVCGTLTDTTEKERPADFEDCTPFTRYRQPAPLENIGS
jgi:hypothetical protein